MAASRKHRYSRINDDAGAFMDGVASLVATLAENRKQKVAMKLKDAAAAARDFGQTLEDLPHLQDYVEEASTTIENLSNYIEATDVREMFAEVQSFARHRPFLTLGAGLAAGIAASKLLESYADHRPRTGNVHE